ncbi:MAG TPA: rhodanese-like domain-containing protein [Chthoniobacterales bacterium]|jgi:rhodanese-related sulfurtransferase
MNLTMQDAKEVERMRGTALLLDVRTPGEYAAEHIAGAALMPLDRLDAAAVTAQAAGRPCVVVCQGGKRASMAAERLRTAGVGNLSVLTGGVNAWKDAGLPLERGRGVISIERQVRIGAGSLVLIGVALGFAVNPWFFGLSAFVGAGLVFAGVTDFCGMALVLAKMPWNQGGTAR